MHTSTDISPSNTEVIFHSRKYLLFNDYEPWIKSQREVMIKQELFGLFSVLLPHSGGGGEAEKFPILAKRGTCIWIFRGG